MCKYEKDPMSIVEDTEWTWFCGQTDKVKPVYPPFNFVEAGGYNKLAEIWRKRYNFRSSIISWYSAHWGVVMHINGLVQQHNSRVLAMELCLSFTKPSIWCASVKRSSLALCRAGYQPLTKPIMTYLPLDPTSVCNIAIPSPFPALLTYFHNWADKTFPGADNINRLILEHWVLQNKSRPYYRVCFKKMHLKLATICRPFDADLKMLILFNWHWDLNVQTRSIPWLQMPWSDST